MSDSAADKRPDWLTSDLLEAYALGHLAPKIRKNIENWGAENTARGADLEEACRNVLLIKAVLRVGASQPTGSEVSDETLARFLDGALDENERTRVQALLLGNPRLQKRLAQTYREGRAAADPRQQCVLAEKRYAGETVKFQEPAPEEDCAAPADSAMEEESAPRNREMRGHS